ncbi:MAG: MBL fold metallo-hydrolase [Acetanaerobacterium sp.]
MGAVDIHVPLIVKHIDFFPASFKLKIHEKVLYIDPVIVEEEEPADYILITHSHQDHFSVPNIRRLLKTETTVICPENVYKKLYTALKGSTIKKTKPGDSMDFDEITIESVEAYNVSAGITPHPKSAMNVGYIITSGNDRLYHAGDTDYTLEMQKLQNISTVLTPIDGGNLTMTTEKAAEFINDLKPRFVVPMHYNIGSAEVEHFKKLVNRDTQVITMDGEE